MTKEMIDNFASLLESDLVNLCAASGFLEGKMGESLDIDLKWENELAKPYLKDAVPQFAAYPDAALAWAAYLGMAVAQRWDMDFNRFKGDTYEFFLGERGWDDMDEHITRDILKMPLSSAKSERLAKLWASCSGLALDHIRHSGAENGTAEAYYVFMAAVRAMYRTGAACQLFSLGYRMTPMR